MYWQLKNTALKLTYNINLQIETLFSAVNHVIQYVSQFNPIRQICSSTEDFYTQTKELETNGFKQRGYRS